MNDEEVAGNATKDNCNLSLSEKLSRFGDDTIALIFPEGSKGRPTDNYYAREHFNKYCYGWPRRTREETLTPEYQEDLYSSYPHNVGIRQTGKIAAWDVDTDDPAFIEQFLKANPIVKETFITKGRRGFTAWFLIEGEAPEETTILLRENPPEVDDDKVEWRFRTKRHSLIHGIHPSGMPYQVLQDKPLAKVEWKAFTCPEAIWSKDWPGFGKQKAKSRVKMPRAAISGDQISRRAKWIEENYEVFDWLEDYALVAVRCKNEGHHTTDNGPRDCVIFTGADEDGRVAYKCLHQGCQDFNKEETRAINEAFRGNETFILHNQNQFLDETLRTLFSHMADLRCFYRRSEKMPYGIIYWRPGDKEPVELVTETLASCLGRENILFSKRNAKGFLVSTLATDVMAKAILGSPYAAHLPIVKLVSKKPLLVKTAEGARLCGNRYVPELSTIVLGETTSLPEVKFADGVALINSVLDFWVWKEPADRARALAELLTPAMLQGGFLKRPIPAMLVTADEPHAGKTLWHSVVSWTYGYEPDPHVMTQNGVGNIQEQLQHSLTRGVPFFFIDELDGTIKNTFVNAFITGGDEQTVRTVYGRFVTVPTDKTMVQLAGVKGFVVDPQLATRTIPIRILKPAQPGYHWEWPDGTLLKDWILKEAPRLLSAIYSVIAEWARIDYPCAAAESRFPSWSIPINGLLANVLKLPHATLGLEDIQGEISSIASMWWPDFISAAIEEELVWDGTGQAWLLSAAAIQGLCSDSGIGVPGTRPELREQALVNSQIRLVNNIIAELPKSKESTARNPIYRCGDFFIIQFLVKSRNGKAPRHYVISRSAAIPTDIVKYVPTSSIGGED